MRSVVFNLGSQHPEGSWTIFRALASRCFFRLGSLAYSGLL